MDIDCENCPYKKAIELLQPHLHKIGEISEILKNGQKEAMELLNNHKSGCGDSGCSNNKP